MKTKLCRPVLVETKEKSQLLINKINRRLLFDCESIIIENAQYQELILISLDPEEKIEIGDKYYNSVRKEIHICENEIEKQSVNQFKEYAHKVIATQSQLPSQYIQHFVEQYNFSKIEDVEIEMIENYDLKYYFNGFCEACTRIDYPDKIKLVNNQVQIIEKKPILYTEKEVKELLLKSVEKTCTKHKAIQQIFKDNLSIWFEQNKKK